MKLKRNTDLRLKLTDEQGRDYKCWTKDTPCTEECIMFKVICEDRIDGRVEVNLKCILPTIAILDKVHP